jgi:hypothetical protein
MSIVKVYLVDEFDLYPVGQSIPLEIVDYIEEKQCPEIYKRPGLEIDFTKTLSEEDFMGAPKLYVHTLEVDELEIIEDKIYDETGYLTKPPIVKAVETVWLERVIRLKNHPRWTIDSDEAKKMIEKIEADRLVDLVSTKIAAKNMRRYLKRFLQGGAPGLGKRNAQRFKMFRK